MSTRKYNGAHLGKLFKDGDSYVCGGKLNIFRSINKNAALAYCPVERIGIDEK